MKPNDTINNIYFYTFDKYGECGLSAFGAGDDRDIFINSRTHCRNVKNYTINNISMGKYLFGPSITFFWRYRKGGGQSSCRGAWAGGKT
jgi:hypothetical protein